MAPDGAEVLLVAMTAETREPRASRKRILNQCETKYVKPYSMNLDGRCQNMF
jgi:hypothetical protein